MGQENKHKDGFIDINLASELFDGSQFKNEKDFCDYIELNIELFCIDCLGVELESYVREFAIKSNGKYNQRKKGSKRIDFYIKSKCGKSFGIECKHPHYVHAELATAMGQVLSYVSIFKAYGTPLDKMYLVSSKCDWIVPQMIKDFNLPIEFVCIRKGQTISLNTNLLYEN